ncbi:MAG: phosphoglucosamine mutase, partial [Candidatus Aenigmarchaeota archaeon]|nr:phosphoglucosamine mutase [Candidatus Aenigmarchaeota archaeon]
EEVKEELGSDGRIIARYSGTEKVFRVMIEGKDKKRIRKMAESIIDEVRKEIGK